MQRFAWALVVMGVGVAPFAVASDALAQSRYYYFDQPQLLEVDTSRIAVFPVEGAVAASSVLTAAGVAAADITPSVVPGLSYASMPEVDRSETGVSELVQLVAAEGAVTFVSPVFRDERGDPMIMTQYLHVGFRDGVDAARAEAILAGADAGTIEARDWTGMKGVYRIRSNARSGIDVLATANQLAVHPDVRFAEPDKIITGHRLQVIPNDPGFPLCWGLHNTGQSGGVVDKDMDAPEAWDITLGDPDIVVVIMDVGAQQDHPDLHQRTGYDATGSGTSGGPLNECDDHGTAVSGCVSAIINNSLGTVGVAPGSRTASAKWGISNVPCDGTFMAADSWLVNSLAWAQAIGARVTNSSFSSGQSSAVSTKFQSTFDAGIVHVAAAGNGGSSSISYPSNLASVMSVAALNRNGVRASFSQWGTGLALSAPGVSVYTTDRTGSDGYSSSDYASADGTSFASPYTAGVAALVLSVDPGLSAAEVVDVLQASAVDLGPAGYDTGYGWGFVNARQALERLTPFELTFPDGVPALLYPELSNTFLLRVVELGGAPISNTGVVHYSVNGGAYQTAPLAFLGGTDYEMWLPGVSCGSIVEYYVTFESTFGLDVSFPRRAPTETFGSLAATGAAVLFADDFEMDQGWTVVDSAGLSDGSWERGVPVGTGEFGDPPADYDGTGQCYLTGNAAGSSDVDAGSTTLISPILDLSTETTAVLAYARSYANDTGSNPGTDHWVVEASGNGVDWVTLEDTTASGNWEVRYFDLASFIGLTDQVQVRFVAADPIPWTSTVEAAVDAVSVTSLSCDAVACQEVAPPLAASPGVAKTRFVSFVGGNVGATTAVRVRFGVLPPPYDVLAGQTMWVGQPVEISEHGGSVDPIPGYGTFFAAPLQCDPFYADWSSYPTVHIFDARIVPGGSYTVQELDASCDPAFGVGYSLPLAAETGLWGDLVGSFDAGAGVWTAPDSSVDVATDVVAQLEGFAGTAPGVSKNRLDVEPALLDFKINITDIVTTLDAFSGGGYPLVASIDPCP